MCPRHPRVLGPRVPVPGLPRAEQVGKGPGTRGPCPGRAESQASGGAWALGPNPQGTALVCCRQDRSRPEDDLVSGRDRLTCPCAFPARDKHDAVCRQTVCVQQGRSQANTHAPWGEAGKGGTRGKRQQGACCLHRRGQKSGVPSVGPLSTGCSVLLTPRAAATAKPPVLPLPLCGVHLPCSGGGVGEGWRAMENRVVRWLSSRWAAFRFLTD